MAYPSPDRLAPGHPRAGEIKARHAEAVALGLPTYADPDTGLEVMTAVTLLRRGWCCESGCRHCPYVGTTDKEAWRRWARTVWASVDRDTVAADVRAVLRPTVRQAARHGLVLTYVALDHELDLDPLTSEIGAECFALARMTDAHDRRLTLHRADSELERHRFGVLQPVAHSRPVDAAELSLVLVPGLVFDVAGTRIGHGVGYYDRLLAGLAGRVRLVGVCAAAVVVPELPRLAHDVAMDSLATETGMHVPAGPPGRR